MIRRFIHRLMRRAPARAPVPNGPRHYRGHDEGIHRSDLSPHALKVCETLHEAGFKAFVVGGAVRDMLLKIRPKDFDVATDATPEEIKRLFRRAMIIGRRFRLVHVMFGREVIETSTFRALGGDAEKDAHGRVLRDNVFGTQHEDAARRDFTVNALYYDPVADAILDWHGGMADLRARTLRMIGDPAERYREDPVRMLRTVRFAAKLGFEIDEPTRAPIHELADLIGNVPAARLFDEMLKLLESGHALACLRRLRAEGLHHGLLPMLDAVLDAAGGERFVTLALSRTDERVRAGKRVSPGFLFATLLWPQVQARWHEAAARGEHSIAALNDAIDAVLDEQAGRFAIQKRHAADMRDIWSLQPRFERRGRSALRLAEHLRFRAGYDFLLLRCDAGELPAELGDWWTRFAEGDAAEREALVEALSRSGGAGAEPRKRRRRKRRSGADAGGGDGRDAGGDDDQVTESVETTRADATSRGDAAADTTETSETAVTVGVTGGSNGIDPGMNDRGATAAGASGTSGTRGPRPA